MSKPWAALAVENIAKTLHQELSRAPLAVQMQTSWDELTDSERFGWLNLAIAVVNGLGDLAPSELDVWDAMLGVVGHDRTEFRFVTAWMTEESPDVAT